MNFSSETLLSGILVAPTAKVIDGLVYKWADVSNGNENRYARLKKRHWEKCTDPTIDVPGGFKDEGGQHTIKTTMR